MERKEKKRHRERSMWTERQKEIKKGRVDREKKRDRKQERVRPR